MAKIANVALTNTFDTWRSRSNEAFDRLSQFAINNSSLYANTLTSNTAFTAKGTATVTGLLTASGRATVGTNLTVSGNTTLGGAGKVSNTTGWFGVAGRATVGTNLFVGGNTTVVGITTLKGSAYIGDDSSDLITITGRVPIVGNMSVSGNTVLGGSAKTVTIGGSGATTNATGWFGVTGRASVSTNLFVGGNTTVAGLLTASGRATIGTNLTVSANTTVTGRLGVGGAPFSNVKFAIIDTTAIKIPSGNTAQRPTGGAGYLRYNVTLASFEGYNTSTSSWGSIGGGAVGNTNSVFWENDKTITANYTITANKNAGTFGPITLNSGVTVTVLANSTWSIV